MAPIFRATSAVRSVELLSTTMTSSTKSGRSASVCCIPCSSLRHGITTVIRLPLYIGRKHSRTRRDQILTDPAFIFPVTVVPEKEVVANRPVVVCIHHPRQWSGAAGLFPTRHQRNNWRHRSCSSPVQRVNAFQVPSHAT